jgi:2-methylcitrate dehydratase PrpD
MTMHAEGKTLSSAYAEFVVGTRFKDLEQEVVHQSKKLFMDLIGVSLAGYTLMEFPRLLVDYMAGLGGTPEATMIGTKRKFPAIHAALVNAACAHALDMDDGHRFAALHPGTVIIPAAIAAAELYQASTRELIAGIVAGYEVMIRVGMAITPSSLNRGFHITGITGPFGAAAAAAKIMGLTHEKTVNALGIAGLQQSGLIQVNHEVEGAMVKPINPAKAAMSGLLSSILAEKGAKGPLHIFEGEDGYLKAVADEVDTALLTKDLGREFEICNVYLKLYAACRHAHASMDAALEAFRGSHIDVTEIQEISIETYPAALRLAGINNATTTSAGRFSIPFSVALALIKGDAGADKYSEENVRDPGIQGLARKVHLSVGSKWERLYPEKRGATATVTDKNNHVWSHEVELAKGEPENPASWEEISKKFYTNATLLIADKEAKKLGDTMMKLEHSSLDELLQLI